MPLNYRISRSNGIVVFDVQGEGTLESLHQLIATVGCNTRGEGDKRVLMNLLAVGEQLKFTDRYLLGEQVARQLGHLDRLAAAVRSERYTGTGEKVANAHGVTLRVFDSVAEAMAWLSEGAAPAG